MHSERRSDGLAEKRYPIIALEAQGVIWLLVLLLVLSGYAFGMLAAAPVCVLLAGSMWLFRDPQRRAQFNPLDVISPVDGCVTDVGVGYDRWLDRDAVRITIRTAFNDAYPIYVPMEGRYIRAWSARSGSNTPVDPGTHVALIETDEGDQIVMVITRHPWTGPIRFRHSVGDRLGHGRRFGFAFFGCIVTVFLPENSRIDARPGDKVWARVGHLAHLTHETAVNQKIAATSHVD